MAPFALTHHHATFSSVLLSASGAAVVGLNEVAHEQSHDCAFLHSTPIQPVMETPFKIGSASGAQMPSPIPMQLDSGATERDRLTLSSGSAPSQASKTKLTVLRLPSVPAELLNSLIHRVPLVHSEEHRAFSEPESGRSCCWGCGTCLRQRERLVRCAEDSGWSRGQAEVDEGHHSVYVTSGEGPARGEHESPLYIWLVRPHP